MSRTALYRHFDAAGRLLYVGISDCLSARDKQHAATAHWHGDVVRTETQWCADRVEALKAEWAAIRDENPIHNVRRCEPFKEKPVRNTRPVPTHQSLAHYLSSTKTRQAEFAADVGISRSFLSEMLHGKRQPSLGVALRIQSRTDGAVPLLSWPKIAAVVSASRETAA